MLLVCLAQFFNVYLLVTHFGAAEPAAEEGEVVGVWGVEVGEEDLMRELFVCESAVCVSSSDLGCGAERGTERELALDLSSP